VLLSDLLVRTDLCAPVRVRDGERDRRIRWTQITELPDPSPWLRGGELVLTNGLWRRRRGDSRRFVDKLVSSEITVLALGLSSVDEPFPKDLTEACDATGLPLLEVRPPVSFTEITKAVAEYYAEQRSKELLRTISQSETLLATLVGGSGASGVLRVLERDHAIASVLFDRAARPLARAGPPATRAESAALRELLAGGEPLPAALALDGQPVGEVYPVSGLGDADGLLLCRGSPPRPSEPARAAIEQALAFLGLELARSQAVHAIERRFAGELVQLIAAGEPRRAEAEERMRGFGLDPRHPSAVVVVSTGKPGDGEALAERVERFLVARGVPAVVPARGHEAIAILEWAGPEADLRALAVELWRDLSGALAVGVGSVTPGGTPLRASLAEARHACRVALRSRNLETPVVTHADIASYSLLFALQDEDVARAFRARVLGSVISYDEQRGADLVHTLDVFLGCAGQWKPAAEKLHVHVNTLRYRLARIEELTGRSLTDMSDRVDLFLALRAGGD
jgi:PucR family transcriptional regulator, purine catabolism regulatory protein